VCTHHDEAGTSVIFLHAILFDRAMRWPAQPSYAPTAPPSPSTYPGTAPPARARYHPETRVEDLAHLLHDIGATQAPIIVGHGTSAGLAALFAARYATHAVITVGAADLSGCPTNAAETTSVYLGHHGRPSSAALLSGAATARPESALLAGYADCLPEALSTEHDSPLRLGNLVAPGWDHFSTSDA
jgi:hypothetical protein